MLVIPEPTPMYELIVGEVYACTVCGATVGFSWMVLHSDWHESLERTVLEVPAEPSQGAVTNL